MHPDCKTKVWLTELGNAEELLAKSCLFVHDLIIIVYLSCILCQSVNVMYIRGIGCRLTVWLSRNVVLSVKRGVSCQKLPRINETTPNGVVKLVSINQLHFLTTILPLNHNCNLHSVMGSTKAGTSTGGVCQCKVCKFVSWKRKTS